MGGSHGFRSVACYQSALFTLAFARPPPVAGLGGNTQLLVGSYSKRHAITHPPRRMASALTAWTRVVSGSVSLPSPGYFSPFPHGTVHYRSRHVACLGPWSAQLPTRLLVSGGTRDPAHTHRAAPYGTVTRSGVPFQALRASHDAMLHGTHPARAVSQPQQRNACMLDTLLV